MARARCSSWRACLDPIGLCRWRLHGRLVLEHGIWVTSTSFAGRDCSHFPLPRLGPRPPPTRSTLLGGSPAVVVPVGRGHVAAGWGWSLTAFPPPFRSRPALFSHSGSAALSSLASSLGIPPLCSRSGSASPVATAFFPAVPRLVSSRLAQAAHPLFIALELSWVGSLGLVACSCTGCGVSAPCACCSYSGFGPGG